MEVVQVQVRKSDLGALRSVSHTPPPLEHGEVMTRIEAFALTANNVTYGVAGDRIGYWRFFPGEAEWGVIPVWGFAEVIESRCEGVAIGERLYGFLPMASHLRLRPERLRADRLGDASAHRRELPPVYNSYVRLEGETGYEPDLDAERMLLFPLYATSFCIYDYLLDNDWFGARRALIASASSKTAIGVAYAMQENHATPRAIGLTSGRNVEKLRNLAIYDEVVSYDDLHRIETDEPSLVIDMAGDGAVISAIANRLGDKLLYCLSVGLTHHDAKAADLTSLGLKGSFFFAPAHIQKRAGDWGPGAFETKALDFWRRAARRSRSWLILEKADGPDAVIDAFERLRDGKTPPDRGLIASL